MKFFSDEVKTIHYPLIFIWAVFNSKPSNLGKQNLKEGWSGKKHKFVWSITQEKANELCSTQDLVQLGFHYRGHNSYLPDIDSFLNLIGTICKTPKTYTENQSRPLFVFFSNIRKCNSTPDFPHGDWCTQNVHQHLQWFGCPLFFLIYKTRFCNLIDYLEILCQC